MSRIFQLGFLFLLILCAKCDDLDYCYSTDVTPYELFSTWTPPINFWAYTEIKESGCKPIYVWGLLKHGVKNITDEQMRNSENLWDIKRDVEQNEKEKRIGLCWDDYQNIHSSAATFSLNKGDNENLAEKVLSSHKLFASHLGQVMQSSPAFSDRKRDVRVHTSEAKEAKNSAIKFADSFLGNLEGNEIVVENKELLRTKSSCANWAANNKEADDFLASPIFESMQLEVSFRLGYKNKLKMDAIETMYESCVFRNLLVELLRPPFCAAFTPAHLKILEYWQDLKHYYEFGYGNSLSEKMGCPLVKEMMQKLSTASRGRYDEMQSNNITFSQWTGNRVDIYFADDENLMGMITRLGLYRDEEPPKHDNYYFQKTNRKWRSSLLSPSDGSVHAIMYNCKNNEKKVELYHNHEKIKFDACKNSQDGKCSFDVFYAEILKNLTDSCDDEFCGSFPENSSGSSIINSSIIVVIVCFLFNRLNLF